MLTSVYLRSLLAYNRWANDRVLEAAEPVLGAEPGYANDEYGTLTGTLLHILQAQETWLARWRGEPPVETEGPSTAELLAAYARSHDALEAFGRGLDDGDLARPLTYRNGEGREVTLPFGQLLTHLVNHSTHHRGEAALLLTRLDRSPGDLDYLDYVEILAEEA